MSFFQTSDGQNAQNSDGNFVIEGGNIAPIPDGTSVLAVAEEAKNADYQGYSYINVKWRISKPAEYGNRVIFHKLHVFDADTKKSDKAKRMLAAIASNAGGGLFKAMEQRKEETPSDMSLAQICNRPMVLKLGVWMKSKDENGNEIPKNMQKEPGGNWVKAVSPAKGAAEASPAAAPKPAAKKAAPAPAVDFSGFDDDIPFN